MLQRVEVEVVRSRIALCRFRHAGRVFAARQFVHTRLLTNAVCFSKWNVDTYKTSNNYRD